MGRRRRLASNREHTREPMNNQRMIPPLSMRLYAWFGHRLPLRSGLTRLAFNPVTNRAFGSGPRPAWAKTQGGLTIEVDVNDYHGRVLYLFGTNDPKVQAVAFELLSPGDIFLDIGANHSTIGLFASRKVGPDGHVHLFEPQPHIADRVEAAIASGAVANARVHRVALLDRDATMTLRVPAHHSGMATLIEHADQSQWTAHIVPVRKISDYVEPLVDAKPFGAKLDVEGAEPLLIPWLVSQPNLKFLIFEAANNQDKLHAQLVKAGMALFGLRRKVFSVQVERTSSVEEVRKFHDLVAVRIGNSPKVLTIRDLRLLLEAAP